MNGERYASQARMNRMRVTSAAIATIIIACLITVYLRDRKPTPIRYLFHFELSEAQIQMLPPELSEIARMINGRKMNAVDSDNIEALAKNCPKRTEGKRVIRMLWRLDGERPDEGDKCILIDLNANDHKVMQCGFVIIG